MVRWKNEDDGFGVPCQRLQRTDGNRRRGVARDRLQQDVGITHLQFLQLFGGEEAVVITGHHHGRGDVWKTQSALHRLLKQRFTTGE